MTSGDERLANTPLLAGEPTMASVSASGKVGEVRDLAIGSCVDRYIVLERVGEGGMGVVFAAYDPRLDRKIAIKLLKLDRGSDDASRASLAREAQSMARLSHGNVVAVHDAGVCTADAGDALYLAMDFVDGRSLREVLTELQATPAWRAGRRWREIVTLFVAAGRGLQAAHEAGIIHRDFKPHNVLVGRDGTVRVADFGLAHSLSARAPLHALADKDELGAAADVAPVPTSAGTPAYMSPEQLAGLAIDASADQFAFCVALYEGLHGERPFEGTTSGALLFQTSNGVVRPPPPLPPVPRRLRRILLRGLQPDPKQRYPTLAALLAEIERDPRALLRAAAPVIGATALVLSAAWAIWIATRPGDVEVRVDAGGATPPGLHIRVGEQDLVVDGTVGRGTVAAGVHELMVVADEHEPHRELVEVQRSGAVAIDVALRHSEGTVDLEVDPIGARILVDGRDYGGRLHDAALPTGEHRFVVQHIGHYDHEFTLSIERGARHQRYVSLARALVWNAPLTGVNAATDWIGDFTGDGRLEVVHRNFNSVLVFDPWQREPWARHAFPGPGLWTSDFVDVDGDGHIDVVGAGGPEALPVITAHAFVGGASQSRLLWRFEGAGLARGQLVSHPAYLDGDGDGAQEVVVVSPWPRTAVLLDGRTGEPRWQRRLDHEAVAVGILDAPVAAPVIVVVTTHAVVGLDPRDGAVQFREPTSVAMPAADPMRLALQSRIWRTGSALLEVTALDGRGRADFLFAATIDGVSRVVAHAGDDGRRLWRAPPGFELLDPPSGEPGGGAGVVLGHLRDVHTTAALSRADGTLLWSAPGEHPRPLEWLEPGRVDVVSVLDEALIVRGALDGFALATIELGAHATGAPVIVDFDRDGRGELAVGLNDATIAVFERPDAAPARMRLPVYARLTSQAVDANADGFPDLVLDANGPAVISGKKTCWRRSAHDAIRPAPILLDGDGDGDLDVVVINDFGDGPGLHVFDARTGVTVARSAGGDAVAAIRTPQPLVDGEGRQGILAADFSRSRVGLWSTADGSVLRQDIGPIAYGTPGLWPQAGAAPGVVIVPWDVGPVRVLDGATWAERWSSEPDAGSWAQPRALDVDRDGTDELLVADHEGALRLYGRDAKAPRWRVDLGTDKHNAVPRAGDVDGDGALELLTSSTDAPSDLLLLRARDGGELYRWAAMGSQTSPGLFVDLDGDARDEIIAAGPTTIHLVRDVDLFSRPSGPERSSRPSGPEMVWRYQAGTNAWADPIRPYGPIAVADLDGDGVVEVVATFDDGSLRVLSSERGTLLWRFDTDSDGMEGGAAIADVDGDGVAEVFIGTKNRFLYCLRSPRG